MRRSWILVVVVLMCFAVSAAGQTGLTEKGKQTIDARLQRLLETPTSELPRLTKSLSVHVPKSGDPTADVLIKASGDTNVGNIAGVVLRTRVGDVITATVTRSGLKTLAEMDDVRYIEPSIKLKRTNNVGTSPSSAFSGGLTVAGTFDLYSYTSTAGASLTVSMHAAPGNILDPFLAICADLACTTILATDNNSGPGTDAEVTYVLPSTGTYYIQASDATDTQTGDYRLILLNSQSGDLLLGTGAKALHAVGNEGQGVIVGVIDTGIDWCHGDFVDDTTGQSRVLFLWDQNLAPQSGELSADVGNDGSTANDYGVEYTQSQITTALADCGLVPANRRVRSADTAGHGTHVAGTAAGDGSATNGAEPAEKYRGTAPKADLIIVKYKSDLNGDDFSSSVNVIEAIDYIFTKAPTLSKPAVINMSLGSHDGPVDGTSLLDQVVRGVVAPGRVIVAAAGNEGNNSIHAEGTIAASGGDTVTVDLTLCTAPDCSVAWINLWHSSNDAYRATLVAPNGQQLVATSGATRSGTLDGVSVSIANESSSPPNGDKNIVVTIEGQGSTPFEWSLTLQRTANGGDGLWDAWALPDQGQLSFLDHVPTNGDGSIAGSIGELASSYGAITVGAHSTKFRWDDFVGGTGELQEPFDDFGNIAQFSSRGPTRDGRIKPDITAPGHRVMSAWSADCPDPECPVQDAALDGEHLIMQGTSMATPMVTGAVALLLQTNATNFPRPLLKSTAGQDSLTGASLPNNTWGAGKINLLTAYDALVADNAPIVSLGANPSSGSATLSATLTATASDADTGDGIAEYLWDFENDGFTNEITTGNTSSASYATAGIYTAKVTVVDRFGKTASAVTAITVLPSSVPEAGPGCFIATAAYGSYLDPHVQVLRAFRDTVLMHSTAGRAFVNSYYAWSPPVAHLIANRPILRGMVRVTLTPVVFTLEWPRLSGVLVVLALVGIHGVVGRTYRRKK